MYMLHLHQHPNGLSLKRVLDIVYMEPVSLLILASLDTQNSYITDDPYTTNHTRPLSFTKRFPKFKQLLEA
jgi:hypothetical protein